MKIKEYKHKIVLSEINPKFKYIMLVDVTQVGHEQIAMLLNPIIVKTKSGKFKNKFPLSNIFVIICQNVDKAIRFVEIPKKNL